MTRRYCRKTRWPFTTSYHTRFPEYVSARLPVPETWCYGLQRRFHNGSAGTFVATPSLEADLKARGFERLMLWSRGVDTELFRPRNVRLFGDGARVSLCRPHRGGKEHQGLSRSRPSRPQGSGRQRTADGGARTRFIPMRCSPGRAKARRWRKPTPRPTCSCFRASPTRSGSCCSRRWPAGVPVAAYPGDRADRRDHRQAGGPAECRLESGGAAARSSSTGRRRGRMRSAIAGRIRRGSSSRTCWRPTIWACRQRGFAAGGKRKRPGRGGTGPFHSHASVWGTLWGNSRPPRDGYRPKNFQEGDLRCSAQFCLTC